VAGGAAGLAGLTGTAIPALVATMLLVGAEFGDFIATKAVPYLREKIPAWKDAIVDYLTGTALPAIGDKAREIGSALVQKFMDEAGKLIGRVRDKMGEVPGAITSGVGDLGRLLYGAGQALIQGLIDGITSKIRELTSTLAGIRQAPGLEGPGGGGPAHPLRVGRAGDGRVRGRAAG